MIERKLLTILFYFQQEMYISRSLVCDDVWYEVLCNYIYFTPFLRKIYICTHMMEHSDSEIPTENLSLEKAMLPNPKVHNTSDGIVNFRIYFIILSHCSFLDCLSSVKKLQMGSMLDSLPQVYTCPANS